MTRKNTSNILSVHHLFPQEVSSLVRAVLCSLVAMHVLTAKRITNQDLLNLCLNRSRPVSSEIDSDADQIWEITTFFHSVPIYIQVVVIIVDGVNQRYAMCIHYLLALLCHLSTFHLFLSIGLFWFPDQHDSRLYCFHDWLVITMSGTLYK